MAMDYQQWCDQNADVRPLIRALKSSMPEQYIGYYLEKAFAGEIEYQKEFDWLGRCSLDIYIPSLHLAIEYDGVFYHANKEREIRDSYKTARCRANKIFIVRIIEKKATQEKSRKRNEIDYYYQKNYKNIDVAISRLFQLINKKYNTALQADVDLARDHNEIVCYIQRKFHQNTIAYIWPESAEYCGDYRYNILHSSAQWLDFKCPHCGKIFYYDTGRYRRRKSLPPCQCELKEIEDAFDLAVTNYRENGIVTTFDETLCSRRLYDMMANTADQMWLCKSKEEAELYKKLGFDSKYIDVYIKLCEERTEG